MDSKRGDCSGLRRGAKPSLLIALACLAGFSHALSAASPDLEGQWGSRIDFTTVPISAAVLPNGKLLVFSSWDRYDFTSGTGARDKTYANLYDPATGLVTEFLVTATDHDMFCPGTAFLEDGRLLVNGGGPQVTTTSLYSFGSNQWVRAENMSRRRWYNASTTMATGAVFTIGGIPDDGVGELWTQGAGWSVLSGAPVTPMTTDGGASLYRGKQHPKLLIAPNGKLFAAGPTPNMQWYDTANGGSVQFAGRRSDDIYAQSNVTVLFDVGKILTAGGNPKYGGSGADTTPSSASAYVIDINAGVTSRKIASMRHGRTYANGVVLPDGKVLVIGGNGTGEEFSDADAVFVPEMFDPATETWTAMAVQATPRTYHSTAVLLPDGRVFSGGGGLCGNCGVNHTDGELYSPPYLFKGSRPVIQSAPTVVGYNAPFPVTTTGSVARFTLVRLSSTTHTVNTDQRFLQLAASAEGGGAFSLTSPLNSNIAPPGYYMLFALSTTGAPSISKIIRLTREDAPVVISVADRSDPVGASVSLPISAMSPQGRPLSYIAMGLPPGAAIHSGTGLISGTLTQTGSFTVTVTVSDGSNANPMTFGWYVYGTDGSSFRYVKLEQISEVNGKPYGSAAELNVMDTSGSTISRTGWVASADSAETASSTAHPAASAIDGSPSTIWHSRWIGSVAALPHWLVLDMRAAYPVGGFRYLPRQDGSSNGRFAQYRFYVSKDGVNWGTPVAQGTFASTSAEKTVIFSAPSPNNPPAVTNPGGQTATVGASVNLPIGASDADGDTLSYSATGLPAGLSIGTGTGVIGGTPTTAGSSNVSVTVGDGRGGSTTASFPWTVASAGGGGSFRYVKLEQISEVNGKSYGSAAELDVLDTSGSTLSRTGWVASADSAETASSTPHPAASAVDAKTNTYWHTRWIGTVAPLPHWLVVDMGASHPVGGFRYLPRQDTSQNGQFAGYRFYVSTDGVNWGAPVAQGTFANTKAEKTVIFSLDPLALDPIASAPRAAGTPVTYTAVLHGGVNPRFSWSFGDGSAATAPAATPSATHTFVQPGRYTVSVTATDDAGATAIREFIQAVHFPPTATPPTASMSIAYEDGRDRVWSVNPDNDTVTVFDALARVKLAEIAVGDDPRGVAVAPDGRIWVVNHRAAGISVIAPDTLQVEQTLALPSASQPYGLAFDPAGTRAYIALEAGGLLVRLDPATGEETGRVAVGPNPRHVSVSADGARVFVSRFITPPVPGEATASPSTAGRGGEVIVIDGASLAVTKTILLQHSDTSDSTAAGRGIPNYLGPAVIAPDGRSAWVPSKQDNIKRGMLRDGRQLSFENTVRATSSRIDLASLAEDPVSRLDHDNSGVAGTALFSQTGDYLFVALESSREVAVIDPYGRQELLRFNVGRAPQGLCLSADGLTLYVHNFRDRTVGIYAIADLVQSGDTRVSLVEIYGTVALESLSPQVLLGKQLFYDARDARLARDRYLSCAACHNDGGQDGRVWDLTGFGEGLRNTIELRGRGGTAHGPLHWSGNFDEVQDFEQQIRNLSGGAGLMSDADFNAGTRSQPLGNPKAGLSADLDALAAYVGSLSRFAPSPYRNADGTLTAEAEEGQAVFQAKGCTACHAGSALTDSTTGSDTLHDIGTLKPSSGTRLGGPLTGIDTPTLRGIWATAPYLHDGSAATASAAVAAHEGLTITSLELDRLSEYLQQLDDHAP